VCGRSFAVERFRATLQPGALRGRLSAMIFPSLNDAERAVLEEMVVHGPHRSVSVPIRGRLALYKLIDETPEGWIITPLGRQALQVAPIAASPSNPRKRDAGRGSDAERHYGKKARDTSWFG
jgi:hypothetical protein